MGVQGSGGQRGRWAKRTVAVLAAAGAIAGCWAAAGAYVPASAYAGSEASASSDGGAATDDLDAARAAYAQAQPQESGECLECHSDPDRLAQAASEGVDPALYLVDADYAQSLHGLLGCTYCHGGDASAADAQTAMASVEAYPTADGGVAVCGPCHGDVVENYATSLHNTTAGLACAYAERLSAASEKAGEDLAAVGYRTAGCPDCHADCGECHVRNARQENFGLEYTGLIDGHRFVRGDSNEDISTTCLTCHAGSIAGCFTQSDVHGPSGLNMSCMDCHSLSEIHGDGVERTTMVHSGIVVTECEDCHSEETLDGQWHSEGHLESVQCWACHTVEYNTCTSCHGWGSFAEGDAFQASNAITLGYAEGSDKITTLVKAPIDEQMLKDCGIALDENDLNTRSSWWPGFAHGVVVPELDQAFCDRCHGEGTALLKEDGLQFPDYEAEQMVGELPPVNVEEYTEG